jgi:branched-chain amino acid transport system ATP-binding protein
MALRALQGVSLSVPEGKLVCVIGSNGAGKTTMLRAVSGLLRAASGDIKLDERSITESVPNASRGAASRTCRKAATSFRSAISDNLLLGAFTRRGSESCSDTEANLDSIYELFRLKNGARSLPERSLAANNRCSPSGAH